MKKLSLLFFLFFFAVSASYAQRTVTGTIVDDTGLPLIGANVIIKNSTLGTITDIDGRFSLEVPANSNALEISYTGYASQEIDITNQDQVLVTLSEGQILEEIVVTAGGLEKNRARLGYAIQNVEADDVLAAKEVNLVDALNSKVAGVSVVSSSGSPGASSNIRIRGNTSIGGANEPLFVVDGVPIDNSSFGNGTDGVDQSNRAIDLNPNDIASLTVLKGPSATALYGVRAANGAIIVTTKKGTSGKPKVSISASYGLDRVNKLPTRQNTYAQGRVTNGVASYLGPASSNGFSWGPLISDLEFDGSDDAFDQGGTLVPVGEGNGIPARAYDPYTFFVDGNTYDFNASVSGGNDDMRYYISAGNLSQTGIVPNSTFSRTSFRVNTDAQITDALKIGASAAYTNSGGNRIQRGSNLNGVMLGLMRTSPTFDNGNGLEGQAAADEVSTYVQENGDQRSYRNGIYDNPYWTVNRNPSEDNVNRIIGNINAAYALTDNLSLGYRLGVDNYSDARLSAFDIQTNPFRPVPGSVSQSTITKTDLNSDLTLSYNTSLSESLGLSALVGYNTFDTNVNWKGTDGTTLSIPGFYHISNATDLTAFESISRKRIHGLYGTADLSFEDYLFLNLTARQDWSSTLPEANNTYQSYSASLGFAFTEALNLNSSVLDYGKLRLSFGVVGNDAPVFSTIPVFTSAVSGGDGFLNQGIEFPNYGVNAFERDVNLANPLLTPEKTTTFEIGGEFKFFRGRFGVDVTYYDSQSEDVIIATDISPTTGYTSITENSAVISNTGIELVLDGTPIRRGNFSWDVAVNFTQMENDVVSLADGIENIGLAGFVSTSADVVAGQPYSAIYGNGWQRNDAGDIVVGADGWPLVDPVRKAIGDPNPDWTAGLRNTFTFGDISLSGLFDIRSGGDMWCGTCGIVNYFGTSEISATERDDVVVFDGVQNTGTAEEPVYVENNTAVALGSADPTASFSSYYRVRYGFGGITEMNVHDTSWLRLRELTVAYNIGGDLLGGIFNGGSIALTGRNLWLSTDYPGIDPETNLTGDSNGYGLDYFNMPNTKSFNATLKLNF